MSEVLLPGSRPAATGHVQQLDLSTRQWPFELAVCLWRAFSLEGAWIHWSRSFLVHLKNDAGTGLFPVHVCLQATSQSRMARGRMVLWSSHQREDGRVYETIYSKYWNTLVPSLCIAGYHCIDGTVGRIIDCRIVGIVDCHYTMEWDLVRDMLHGVWCPSRVSFGSWRCRGCQTKFMASDAIHYDCQCHYGDCIFGTLLQRQNYGYCHRRR
mmetsp:Transcript_22361/g.41638  ORF Transcript_22361/g.41638 Transcript_22361/m.41638 type:complete len:211 (-) Transcript_22361:525-1157(-)